MSKVKSLRDLRTAGDVKNFARSKGATVEPAGKWDRISHGTSKIFISKFDNQQLDKCTLGNLKRWLATAGLLLLLLPIPLYLIVSWLQ